MDLEMEIACPNCKRKHKRRMDQLKKGSHIKCPCGADITIGDDGFTKSQKAMDDFQKSLKKMGFK